MEDDANRFRLLSRFSVARLIAVIVLTVIAPIVLLGASRSSWLYGQVSLTNSPELDAKLRTFQERGRDFNLIAIGSSEVRWGISPDDIDAGFRETAGVDLTQSFNFGMDGFTQGIAYLFFERTGLLDDRTRPGVLLVGVNLGENVSLPRLEFAPGTCGSLQKPILTSALGKGAGLHVVCEEPATSARLRKVTDQFWLFRERSAVRDLIVGARPRPAAPEIEPNGFHPHLSAGAAAIADFLAGLEQMRVNEPERFIAPSREAWLRAFELDGFFPTVAAYARERDLLPVFFALPTNPVSIDAFGLESAIDANSKLLRSWADANDAVFIDLGVQRDLDPAIDYADFRHLSGAGGRTYSRGLGGALAKEEEVIEHLSNGRTGAMRR